MWFSLRKSLYRQSERERPKGRSLFSSVLLLVLGVLVLLILAAALVLILVLVLILIAHNNSPPFQEAVQG